MRFNTLTDTLRKWHFADLVLTAGWNLFVVCFLLEIDSYLLEIFSDLPDLLKLLPILFWLAISVCITYFAKEKRSKEYYYGMLCWNYVIPALASVFAIWADGKNILSVRGFSSLGLVLAALLILIVSAVMCIISAISHALQSRRIALGKSPVSETWDNIRNLFSLVVVCITVITFLCTMADEMFTNFRNEYHHKMHQSFKSEMQAKHSEEELEELMSSTFTYLFCLNAKANGSLGGFPDQELMDSLREKNLMDVDACLNEIEQFLATHELLDNIDGINNRVLYEEKGGYIICCYDIPVINTAKGYHYDYWWVVYYDEDLNFVKFVIQEQVPDHYFD